MIEKEYALKLRHELDGYIFQKIRCFYIYSYNEEELLKCNYKLLQEECENLNFHIYQVKESPILQDEIKTIINKNEAYIVYSDYSLTLKSKF